MPPMIFSIHNFKVVDPIVTMVAVLMVNELFGFEFSAKKFLHNMTMLIYGFAVAKFNFFVSIHFQQPRSRGGCSVMRWQRRLAGGTAQHPP